MARVVGALLKWVIIPAACGAVGFYVIAPRLTSSGGVGPIKLPESKPVEEPKPDSGKKFSQPEVDVDVGTMRGRTVEEERPRRRRRRRSARPTSETRQSSPPAQSTSTSGGDGGGGGDGGTGTDG